MKNREYSLKNEDEKKGRNSENVQLQHRVEVYYREHPETSVKIASAELEVPQSTLYRTLKAIKMKPYKKLKAHKITENNKDMRKTFCFWFLSHRHGFEQTIIFSDEKWWVADSAPNSQNERFWSTVPPQNVAEVQYQGKTRVMCWMAIFFRAIIGLFWFLDVSQNPISVNQHVYLQMLENSFWPKIENHRILRRCWYQQDGAPCHCKC